MDQEKQEPTVTPDMIAAARARAPQAVASLMSDADWQSVLAAALGAVPAPSGNGASTAWQPTHRHYKGGFYRLLFEAIHSETEEAMAVYQTPDGRHWVRPAAMFYEVLPDGRPRFAPIKS